MPVGPPNDPPGYWQNWPLANAAKRLLASLIDWVGFWVLAWIGLGVLAKMIGAVGGETARQSSLVPMVIVIHVLGYYNVGLQQSRTGQSWGKRILGIRLVKMTDSRPPSKLDLTFRPVIGFFEMLSGIGILSMLLSRYRQSFTSMRQSPSSARSSRRRDWRSGRATTTWRRGWA